MSKQGFLKGLVFKDTTTEQDSTENPSPKGKDTKPPVISVTTTTVQGVADNKFKESISNKQVSINFSTNSYTLSDEAKSTIDKEFVNIAKTFANARIRIEGNTDAVGKVDYNKTLSFKRAQSVANYLSNDYGFDPNRFIVIGNGMTKAVAAGETGSNELYRRTDFKLVED